MFQEQFPEFNSYGWGVSIKAERWNGRHAMFGWAFIIATGYCKAHGLIPDPEKLLDFKQWGTLAIISGGKGVHPRREHPLPRCQPVRGLLPAPVPGHFTAR